MPPLNAATSPLPLPLPSLPLPSADKISRNDLLIVVFFVHPIPHPQIKCQQPKFGHNPLPAVQNTNPPAPSPANLPSTDGWLSCNTCWVVVGVAHVPQEHTTLPTQFLFFILFWFGVKWMMKISIPQLDICGSSSPIQLERRRLSRSVRIHVYLMIRRGE